MQMIRGNTYPVRNALKGLGAKWDSFRRGWWVIDAHAPEARQLVAQAPHLPRSRKR